MMIGQNLRRLRNERGMTQAVLAEAAGLSRAGYRKIETDASEPRVDTLRALAEALGVKLRTLVTPVPELQGVRFRSFKSLRTRGQILADVSRRLRDFDQLEGLLDDRVQYTLSHAVRPSSLSRRDPEQAAAHVRKRFGLHPDEPIHDLCGLLEANGIKLLPMSVASDAFFGLSVAEDSQGPAIAVNTWERISVERWIFTAAHELGHLVLHPGDYRGDGGDPASEEEAREREANVFAAHFLMPEEVFRREWEETYGMALVPRVLKVKRIFRVSYRTVLYRLAEPARDKSAVWKRFQGEYKRRHGKTLLKRDEPQALAASAFHASSPEPRRAGEPENLSPLDFQEDRLARLVRRAVEAEEISLGRAAEILDLPLQQMRELSRSWVA